MTWFSVEDMEDISRVAPTSDVPAHLGTVRRLCEVPVAIVRPGHDNGFGRETPVVAADRYVARRAAG